MAPLEEFFAYSELLDCLIKLVTAPSSAEFELCVLLLVLGMVCWKADSPLEIGFPALKFVDEGIF